MIGTILAERYEIIEKIGSGGSADVYLASDIKLHRKVAVKILSPLYASNRNFVARFKKEAQILARLNDPNIVAVFDWGQFENSYFICMEYVEGLSLSEIIEKQGIINPATAARYSVQICNALEIAHKNNLIHRDIKPQNIIVTSDGTIKIIAKINIPYAETVAGEKVMGTTYYMSPEQIMGDKIDLRTDIYSLGILLYEMVTGKNPYASDTPLAVINGHLYKTPIPIIETRKDIPEYLINIISKCIAKNKNDRFSSASEIIKALKSKEVEKIKIKSSASLVWEGNQRIIEISNEFTLIGRGEINNIILKDGHVSRQHAKIRISDGNYIIEDLGSMNGTFVNGEKINICYLKNGDKIKIGNNVFIFNS